MDQEEYEAVQFSIESFTPHTNTAPQPLPHLKCWCRGGKTGSEIPIVSLLRFSMVLQKGSFSWAM